MARLFDPITINTLRLENRFIMPAWTLALQEKAESLNPRLTHYFLRRARGGVAFIMVGPASLTRWGGGKFEYRLYRTTCSRSSEPRRGHSRLGVPVGLQLHHAGRQANPVLISGMPVAPSAIMCPSDGRSRVH